MPPERKCLLREAEFAALRAAEAVTTGGGSADAVELPADLVSARKLIKSVMPAFRIA